MIFKQFLNYLSWEILENMILYAWNANKIHIAEDKVNLFPQTVISQGYLFHWRIFSQAYIDSFTRDIFSFNSHKPTQPTF